MATIFTGMRSRNCGKKNGKGGKLIRINKKISTKKEDLRIVVKLEKYYDYI